MQCFKSKAPNNFKYPNTTFQLTPLIMQEVIICEKSITSHCCYTGLHSKIKIKFPGKKNNKSYFKCIARLTRKIGISRDKIKKVLEIRWLADPKAVAIFLSL